ncbi:GtrA family protein [Paenibacillus sp. sptzw28]|uniref:GtrA family protein n=1 Tax=Paenibacillus sp. sptzw28 TaxID=715179 RepID=UPI001C6E48DA|nr:GtrA family protein [Paenibacillus sp. sptzw28]QYR22797.1 GtrA family protein [Paenibacillus sp. sptzw28]
MNNRFIQMLKFGLVGAVNTAVDLIVFTLLTAQGLPYLAAQIISYSCGVLNSYLLNRSWTFRHGSSRKGKEIIRFIIVNLTALAVSSALLTWLYRPDGSALTLPASKLIVTCASMVINYAGSRYWVFGSLANNKE